MAKVPYTKPALDYASQLQQLKDRKLHIEDDAKALHLLENISYYRLSGYWYPMLDLPKSAHIFKPGSTFNNAFKLYCFDREFRQLVLGQLEKIEVAVRAKMIYILSHKNGTFWHDDETLFSNKKSFYSHRDKLKNEYDRSDEEFIKAFRKKYFPPPPSWMILEVSSFGNLSSLYKNLKPGLSKREIANYFGLDDSTFASWLHSFTYVRNVCAHHSRLWNKKMGISPKVPLSPANQFIVLAAPNNKTYFLLSMIIYLLNVINPKHTFKNQFLGLLTEYPTVDVSAMGFPVNWKQETLWK